MDKTILELRYMQLTLHQKNAYEIRNIYLCLKTYFTAAQKCVKVESSIIIFCKLTVI